MRYVEVAKPDVFVEDEHRPDVPGWDLRAVHTPGHTSGNLCFETPGRGRSALEITCCCASPPDVSVYAQALPRLPRPVG